MVLHDTSCNIHVSTPPTILNCVVDVGLPILKIFFNTCIESFSLCLQKKYKIILLWWLDVTKKGHGHNHKAGYNHDYNNNTYVSFMIYSTKPYCIIFWYIFSQDRSTHNDHTKTSHLLMTMTPTQTSNLNPNTTPTTALILGGTKGHILMKYGSNV